MRCETYSPVPAAILGLLALFSLPPATAQQEEAHPQDAATMISCSVLETHTSTQPDVTIVLFHQSDRSGQQRLAALLKEADGTAVEIRTKDGGQQRATVARLRDCFGRGLLIFPSGSVKLSNKDEFTIRFTTPGRRA